METKYCTKCEKDVEIQFFNKNKNKKDGLQDICNPCRKQVQKDWYNKNKEKHKSKVIGSIDLLKKNS